MPVSLFFIVRTVVTLSTLWALGRGPDERQAGAAQQPDAGLGPTAQAPAPVEDADAWLVPDRAPDERERALAALAAAVGAGDHDKALALAPALAADRDLGGYARLYQARALLAKGSSEQARQVAAALASEAASPFLASEARLLAAAAAMQAADYRGAVAHLDAHLAAAPRAPHRALLMLGRAHAAAGDRASASLAFSRVYYEFALTTEAAEAGSELAALNAGAAAAWTSERVALETGRAERFFGARRMADARRAFEALREAPGADSALVQIRLAEIDAMTGRHAQARAALARHMDGPRKAEARFFDLVALRELGQGAAFISGVRALVNDFPGTTWAADALDALGTYYILQDDDDAAAGVFTELFDRFPQGERAERAAWKAGWHAYRRDNFAETIRIFERAAAAFPRSNQRPAWLYWTARAHAALGNTATASARHGLVLDDYAHSYYGRQAARHLGVASPAFDVARAADRRSTRSTEETAREAVPNGLIIHRLLRAGLYDDALGELQAAEQQWGSTPVLQATIAWATREKGDLLRASVLMKRAYPQYLAREGASLPDDVLRVTYPVNYWTLIKKYSAAHKLDPYLIAALIAQESGYDPAAKSGANAWGLMQIVPATGRSFARKLGIRRFTTRSLTDPEINIRIGTAYFADQIDRLGSVHAALAGYNAGPSRARRWAAERPGLERDEWIDDIPFPETQFYVKRILGTAEDYRALYSGGFDPALKRTSPRPRGASGGE
jgi:soluble lytic murein transglycosylase